MKNKTKKAISLITALMLISSSSNVIHQSIGTAAAQSIITDTINVVIPENTSVTNGMFTITYDAEKLKLENAETDNYSLGSMMISVNTKTDGKVVVGFVSSNEVDVSGKAVSLSFSRIGNGNEDISELCSITVNEFVTVDSENNEIKVNSENVKLEKENTFHIEQLETAEKEQYVLLINTPQGQNITNGILTVKYDTSCLELEECTTDTPDAPVMYETNKVSEGVLMISFVSTDETAGKNFRLTFKGIGEGDAEVSVSANELSSVAADGTVRQIDVAETSYTVSVSGSASADAEFGIKSNDETEDPEVFITFPENTGVTNGILTVKYDPEHLSFKNFEKCDVLQNAMTEINEISPGTLSVAFISSKEINSSGDAIKLVFSSRNEGTSDVSVSAYEFLSVAIDGTVKNINTVPSSCTIKTTVSYEPKYDLNDDGAVTAADIIVLVKYILSEEAVNDDAISKADINGNGKVDVFDLIRLKRCIIQS